MTLFNVEGNPVSTLAWVEATPGSQIIKSDEGNTAQAIPAGTVLEVLQGLGNYDTFLRALEVIGGGGTVGQTVLGCVKFCPWQVVEY